MTHVTFLHSVPDRFQAAAQWLALAEQRQTQIAVIAPEGSLALLERVLWEVPATGFTPHCRATHRNATETPVVLTSDLTEISHNSCVLNLTDEVPAGFERFDRLVEIISRNDADRLPGRERYRYYRDHGYQLQNTDKSQGFNR